MSSKQFYTNKLSKLKAPNFPKLNPQRLQKLKAPNFPKLNPQRLQKLKASRL
jgi:hypothetical protein